jgi:hypothetical protein
MIQYPRRHFMIDLETMGLKPTSAIVSIGCTFFNQTEILDQFHQPITLQSCLDAGLTQDQSTVEWWSRQSVDARSSWDNENAVDLNEGLLRFVHFLRLHSSEKTCCPWGNGSDFDIVLLVNAFDKIGADAPWKFYNHHCFRTMKNVFQVGDVPRTGTYHSAIDDAITQTKHLHRILNTYSIQLT